MPEVCRVRRGNLFLQTYDNPFEFNDELYQQMKSVRRYHKRIVLQYCNDNDIELDELDINDLPEDSPVRTSFAYMNHNLIMAPGGAMDCFSYINPSEEFEGLSNTEEDDVPQVIKNMERNRDFPYVPGWSFDCYWGNGKTVPNDWVNAISAGVDCVGFAQRSASYRFSSSDHNEYLWADILGHNLLKYDDDSERGEDWYNDKRGFPTDDNNLAWEIETKLDTDPLFIDGELVVNQQTGRPVDYWEELKLVCPGDLFIQYIEDVPFHIGIIQNVEDVNGDGLIYPEDIFLIESTWGGRDENDRPTWACVVKQGRTLHNYRLKDWRIVRLR